MISEEARLIEQYIEQNPHRPGRDEARLIGYGVPVWALVGYLKTVSGDVRRVALDYDLPYEVVRAALLYYERHKDLIDARLEANEAPDDSGTPALRDMV